MARLRPWDEMFWTAPSLAEDSHPTDPLGLDVMREELSDRLVPCLGGRTRSHEDFFWTLTLLHWATSQPTESAKVQAFLEWERCLKLYWVKQGRKGFTGVEEATRQSRDPNAPSIYYRPLLVNQRSNGLLGAHLAPIRKLASSNNSLTA